MTIRTVPTVPPRLSEADLETPNGAKMSAQFMDTGVYLVCRGYVFCRNDVVEAIEFLQLIKRELEG